MSVIIITGSAGLIDSEAGEYFAKKGYQIVGIDNDMRRVFFGEDASTRWKRDNLIHDLGKNYQHEEIDIRDQDAIERVFRYCGKEIAGVIHAAAQPSHDWAASELTQILR